MGASTLLAPDAPPPANAARTIDATGKVVAPGFIDLHSHGGLMILADGRHEPKVRQGVTTELVGVDGNGFAPFVTRADLLAFVNLDAGLDGRPEIDYDWTSVASYLERYDGTVSLNVATLVGNSQLGSRGSAGRTCRRTRPRSTGCAACCATGWPRVPSG